MGSKGFMWHVAQIFQILAAGAWAITCLIPAFTIPRDTTSHNDVDATGRRRSYVLALWVGTALGWFFFAAGIIFYIALVLTHRRTHKGGSSRNCTVWITTGFRVLGAVAGIALGAYYVHRRLKRIYPALALAFIFAFACIVAVFFTITRRQKAHVVQRGHMEKDHRRDGVLPTGHHQQRRGWRSRF